MSKALHSEALKHFLQDLQAARVAQNISQVALGEKLNRTQSFISKVERGERRLDIVEFCEWALALGYEPTQLLSNLSKPMA